MTALRLKFLLPFLLGLLPAMAAPPVSVAGLIYYETGATYFRSSYSHGLLLNADGTFRLFYEASASHFATASEKLAVVSQRMPDEVREGTWTYRVLDDRHAELELGGNLGKRALTFSEGATGMLASGGVIYSGNFKLISPEARPALVNSSNRSFVPAGKSALVGFVVTEAWSRVLVRAVGPGLRAFGVEGPLATPMLQVGNARGVFAQSGRWTDRNPEMIRRTSALVGAFPLADDAADAATIVTLERGAYTARVAGATAEDGGEVLIEVYLLP